MKNKTLAILGVTVIALGTIGGVVFASSINNNIKNNKQIVIEEKIDENKKVIVEEIDRKLNKDEIENKNYNMNSANNPSKDIFQDMIKIMRDNGYNDAARYMQTGNYEAMTDYMNNISEEDYNKMIEIMNNNGYSYMGQMMQSLGREGMIQMHNSMSAMHRNNGSFNNMMGY